MQTYSTLEVQGVEIHDPHRIPDNYAPQLTPFENYRADSSLPEAVIYPNKESPYLDYPPTPQEPQPRKHAVCQRAVIVGAIAGGVGGGLSSTNHSHNSSGDPGGNDPNTSNPGDTSTHSNVNILNISRLASSSQTDDNGYLHRTVFFQDTNSAIISREWDSQNKTWTTINITDIMSKTPTPLNPLPGTPLASASCYFGSTIEAVLWFVAPDNHVSATYAQSAASTLSDWKYYKLADNPYETYPGSQLAVAWQRCWNDDCMPGSYIVAYQTPEGAINVANASDWNNPATVIETGSVARNSSLAIVPQREDAWIDGVVLVADILDSQTTGTMRKTVYHADQRSWHSNGSVIETLLPPSSILQFAAIPRNDFTDIVFLTLFSHVTVSSGDPLQPIPIHLYSGPSSVNFTAIATSEDSMLYGISNDEILQYTPEDSELSTFAFVERVYP
ncbi:hypothetical protein M426DRAFT_259536 [Hypoxylon sp. CI-4A]|nr:hypothetical protein M426DRAFT_259536 [Hypoxylon sp. CI-4A]